MSCTGCYIVEDDSIIQDFNICNKINDSDEW
jgi:hypothetical protein